jgi:hypothetical protein
MNRVLGEGQFEVAAVDTEVLKVLDAVAIAAVDTTE